MLKMFKASKNTIRQCKYIDGEVDHEMKSFQEIKYPNIVCDAYFHHKHDIYVSYVIYRRIVMNRRIVKNNIWEVIIYMKIITYGLFLRILLRHMKIKLLRKDVRNKFIMVLI